jgi:hypothetical protein
LDFEPSFVPLFPSASNSERKTQNFLARLLTRHNAIDVPVASVAGVEKFFVIASKSAGFHDVEGNHEGAGQ